MGYNLFLDDERMPRNVTWIQLPNNMMINHEIVRNYDEFVRTILSFGMPDSISFDHDLADEHYTAMQMEYALTQSKYVEYQKPHPGDGPAIDYGPEKTGYECAKWLVQHCMDRELKIPIYTVHSLNPIGGQRIKDYLEWAKAKFDL